MADKRPADERDRILVAQIHGTAKRHAQWRELDEDEHAAAVGELRELAAGRADLLAHVAGIVEGFSEGQLDEPLARQAAGLCRDAGADPEAIPHWIEEGRCRRAVADMPPMSGGLHGGGARRVLAPAKARIMIAPSMAGNPVRPGPDLVMKGRNAGEDVSNYRIR